MSVPEYSGARVCWSRPKKAAEPKQDNAEFTLEGRKLKRFTLRFFPRLFLNPHQFSDQPPKLTDFKTFKNVAWSVDDRDRRDGGSNMARHTGARVNPIARKQRAHNALVNSTQLPQKPRQTFARSARSKVRSASIFNQPQNQRVCLDCYFPIYIGWRSGGWTLCLAEDVIVPWWNDCCVSYHNLGLAAGGSS